jgi:hypothetical protein
VDLALTVDELFTLEQEFTPHRRVMHLQQTYPFRFAKDEVT